MSRTTRVVLYLMGTAGLTAMAPDVDMSFNTLRDQYLQEFRKLTIQSNRSWWEASITGKSEDFKRREEAEQKLVDLHSDPKVFAALRSFKNAGSLSDPIEARELAVMYKNFLPYQVDPEISKQVILLTSQIDQIFNTHRSPIGDSLKTENEVRSTLADSTQSAEVEAAWKGYMLVGKKIESHLKKLVRLRNQIAQSMGFRDFFAMQLEIQELDEKELFELFDELDALTSKPFEELKSRIDQRMAKRFGITVEKLRPWHMGDLFFQEAPALSDLNLDEILKDRDPIEIAREYYQSIGMPVDRILERSDLYEKDGKSPHAFCTSIDRDKDVRILCNVQPNMRWMDTVLHELGHAVYDVYIGDDVPFILHEPAHILTTEGIAMLFGAMAKNERFLMEVVKLPPEKAQNYIEAAHESLRAEKLIFSRWTQVMLRFEREMYRDPDQDLNQLWWSLRSKYQGLNPPEDPSGADYGAKIHIVAVPVYYHNYMLGDLLASQVHHHIATRLLKLENPEDTCFYNQKTVGTYFKEKFFAPGNRTEWRDFIRQATGEPLSAKYFAEHYVQ